MYSKHCLNHKVEEGCFKYEGSEENKKQLPKTIVVRQVAFPSRELYKMRVIK